MSDPRSTGRASKTVAVVMLLVFLQVLVVAILGLSAIERDRREGRRQALLQADAKARSAFRSAIRRAEEEVQAALFDARTRTTFADLERLLQGVYHGHAALIRSVFYVDPDTGVVYWMDGEHRLLVPPQVRAEMIRREREEEARAAAIESPHTKNYGFPTVYELLREHLTDFPLRLTTDESGMPYPVSVAYAIVLVQRTAMEVEFKPTETNYQLLEQALLDTLEVVALNAGREDIPAQEANLLDLALGEVEAAVAALPPEQAHIRSHVEAFRDARREVVELRPALAVALEGVETRQQLTSVGPHLLAVIPGVALPGRPLRHLVVRLNETAMSHLVEDQADSEEFARLGVELRLVAPDAPSDEAAIATESLRPRFGVPVRAELVRVQDPILPSGGPSELFYWGIVLLSATGLIIGVWVLVRLYTREVRLARLKADFVSNLSHELKTPITSISIFTEMLQEGQLEDEEDRREGFAVLAQEAQRLQRIVQRMLDVAKREARGTPYERAPGDLREPIRAAVERFDRIVTEPGLDLELSLPDEPLPMLLDRAALDDAITNLVSNAWKYKRGDEASIRVDARRVGRQAEVVVRDDGVGIPRRERRKVFEMFYRAEAYLTRSVAGTGLGLALVRTIVKAHDGTVRIEEGANGVGTTFRLRFPLSSRTAPASAASNRPPATPAATTEATS